jgi:pimeloyl-ACP methyl ester carboxylesterase
MSQRALIMIHGFRGTHHGLALIAKEIDSATTIVPDLPGFGKGDMLHHYDLDSYVEWLHGFVLSQKLKKAPDLLGHSFGSIVCAAYAVKYPETIRRLILVNPIGAPALEGPRGILSKLAVAYYWIGKHLPARVGRAWLSSWASVMLMSSVMAKTKSRRLRKFIHTQHLTHFSSFDSPNSVYDGFVTSISHSVRDVAKDISTKTLLIAGEKDDITPIEKQHELAALFRDAELKTIKNVGHLTHYETPKQVAELVQAFIKSE